MDAHNTEQMFHPVKSYLIQEIIPIKGVILARSDVLAHKLTYIGYTMKHRGLQKKQLSPKYMNKDSRAA